MKMKMLKLVMAAMLICSLLLPVMASAEYENGDPPLCVEVTLRSNPSTGYAWTAACDNESVLEVIHNGFYADEENLLGSGGVDDFGLSGLAEGIAVVTFTYARGDEEPLYTIVYNVMVEENGDAVIYGTSFGF